MNSQKKFEKPIEKYRRDIFVLKSRLKEKKEYLQQLRQQHSNLDVIGGEQSYTYAMKLKIMKCTILRYYFVDNFEDFQNKMKQYATHQAYDYYALNYATLALKRACEVVGLTPQMVYRGVDIQRQGKVGWFQFNNFLRQVFRMNSQLNNPIMKILDPNQTGLIQKERYQFYLQSFMIQKQQNGQQFHQLIEAINRVVLGLINFKIELNSIWKRQQINIATFIFGLKQHLKKVDELDIVVCYCKCDPLKKGEISQAHAINFLQHKIDQYVNFNDKKIRLKK